MARRKLEELNLLDDFLFGSMVTYPGIGEAFTRILLKIIFQRDFGKLKVIPQRPLLGSDTDLHGARLDVYLEEDTPGENTPGNATIYDVEPDNNDDTKSVTALPKRVRFYHAKIDSETLGSGKTYHALKNVIIILIMPYDPFGLNRMVYTIQSCCREEPQMPYDDGARTLFLYTRGTAGNPPLELRQLLTYMEHTTKANAKNENLKQIQSMVETVKRDKGVSVGYMKVMEREQMMFDKGMEQGIKQGIEQGISQGMEQGVRQGRQAEAANTERERRRANAAEEEIRRLKEQLERLQKQKLTKGNGGSK